MDFCRARGVEPLPAQPEAVRAYAFHCTADRGLDAQTVEGRMSTVLSEFRYRRLPHTKLHQISRCNRTVNISNRHESLYQPSILLVLVQMCRRGRRFAPKPVKQCDDARLGTGIVASRVPWCVGRPALGNPCRTAPVTELLAVVRRTCRTGPPGAGSSDSVRVQGEMRL